MKRQVLRQADVYQIDLASLEGNGEFNCPGCGTTISPDDDTEDTYSILEPKVDNAGLKEVIIRCNNCESQIHLTGFSLRQ